VTPWPWDEQQPVTSPLQKVAIDPIRFIKKSERKIFFSETRWHPVMNFRGKVDISHELYHKNSFATKKD
jgi:hypothetical protein